MVKDDFRQQRPQKEIFSQQRQEKILRRAVEFVKRDLLPHPNSNKLILFGSLARGDFGRYREEYKERIYSDIDILLLVDNEFEVPDSWELQFGGDPELKSDLYRVYNYKKVDDKFLVQYMVCRQLSYQQEKNREVAEDWGIPLKLEDSEHAYKLIYEGD